MNRAVFLALTACVVSAMLEGVFAGRGVKEYMASLRMPRFAPSMRVWYVIGALYYIACFVVLYRLIDKAPPDANRTAAITLTLVLMSINAGWNYIFFRARNLFAVLLTGIAYTLVAFALMACLIWADTIAALVFAPYLVYLVFANFWGYQLWRLNP